MDTEVALLEVLNVRKTNNNNIDHGSYGFKFIHILITLSAMLTKMHLNCTTLR